MKNLVKTILVMSVLIAASRPVGANTITITLPDTLFTVQPGQNDVAVLAGLSNTDPVNAVFLNSDNLSVPGAAAVNDEFFANVPFSLAAGESTQLIEIFRFDVAPNATAGTFTGSYQLLGGVGTANQFNFDPVGSATFTININAVPEPATFLLLGSGLVAISLRARSMRRSGGSR